MSEPGGQKSEFGLGVGPHSLQGLQGRVLPASPSFSRLPASLVSWAWGHTPPTSDSTFTRPLPGVSVSLLFF